MNVLYALVQPTHGGVVGEWCAGEETMVVAEGRPKTLEEVRRSLRDRLERGRPPLALTNRDAALEVIGRIESLDGEHWGSTWGEMADHFEAKGRQFEADGDLDAARAAYLQAYAFNFAGRYPCPNSPAKARCAATARDNYQRAGALMEPPLERVVIPFDGRAGEGTGIVVYARTPRGVVRPPVVLQWGGIDGYKEERHEMAEAFLRAGFATVAIDSPGTGESPILASEDGERQYTPVLEWIRARPEVDGSCVAGIGTSFGGYWATKLAHTHRQYFRGVVSWGGGAHFNFQPEWTAKSRYADSYLMDLAETRAHMLGLGSYEEYVDRIRAFSLVDQGVLRQPCAPLLLVNGKEDRQVPIQDLYLVLEYGSPKFARVFPGGHMGRTPDTFPTILAWIQDRLEGL